MRFLPYLFLIFFLKLHEISFLQLTQNASAHVSFLAKRKFNVFWLVLEKHLFSTTKANSKEWEMTYASFAMSWADPSCAVPNVVDFVPFAVPWPRQCYSVWMCVVDSSDVPWTSCVDCLGDGATAGSPVMGCDCDCDDDLMMACYCYCLMHSCCGYCCCCCCCLGYWPTLGGCIGAMVVLRQRYDHWLSIANPWPSPYSSVLFDFLPKKH